MTDRRHKHWGWGFADEQPSEAELDRAVAFLRNHLGFGATEAERPAPLAPLRPARLKPPAALAAFCAADDHARAVHSYGASYRDVVRGFRGEFACPPDVVARPRSEADVAAVLEWALGSGAAVVPFGGGTSVVGGVEPVVGGGYSGVVTIDLKGLDRVLEVDPISLSARIQAGATGPGLEAQLAPHGLTLRHFPQSFQFQTLGGAIATRAGGHFATGPTHIDDFVQSIRALTPSGAWESRRLPGSGAGVSPDRMLLGSEGTLGVITEAWVRVLRRPRFRSSAAVRFPTFREGAAAARAIVQSGLRPSNCRLIDPDEARLTLAGDGSCALLLIGFESADHEVAPLLAGALDICRDGGGVSDEGRRPEGQPESAEVWRDAFFRAPYLRDTLVAMGVLSETFESAITWDEFDSFIQSVTAAARAAVAEACGDGHVSVRLTHVYTDGAAPYFTVVAPARRGEELEQWAAIKQAASDAVIAAGGTITHHHAVGRDHRTWYDRQRPEVFNIALTAAKRAVDPAWALNPGVLLDRPA